MKFDNYVFSLVPIIKNEEYLLYSTKRTTKSFFGVDKVCMVKLDFHMALATASCLYCWYKIFISTRLLQFG